MYPVIKRILDFTVSFFGFLVLSPLFLTIMLIVKLTSDGPVFFMQERVGIHKNRFMVYKFRTMRIDTPKDTPTHLLENPGSYITPVGRFLRKTSLDELPQLLNIIKGEMSVIGPRPALWNQDDLVAERELYGANDVLPGLSGWAQINGRDELPIEIKARLDGEYIEHFGLVFDFKCFIGTIKAVLRSDGIVEGAADKSEAVNQTGSEPEADAANVTENSDFEVLHNPAAR